MKRDFRKPLIVMTPKSLLRHKLAVSSVLDLTEGTFHEVLDDTAISEPVRVSRVLLCSGKIYYDLLTARENQQTANTAIVRVEQLYPFPEKDLREILARYHAAQEIAWIQEEPRNMGAWSFISEYLPPLLRPGLSLRYIGRGAQASPAVGSQKIHQKGQAALVGQALAVEK
jgi:2-oxoglutarate dehydrogenase E1 component